MTLHSCVKGRKSRSLWRSSVLPEEAERELAACLITLEKWEFGLSGSEVLSFVEKCITYQIKTPFKNNLLFDHWFFNNKKE
jgi:hypothetical protein